MPLWVWNHDPVSEDETITLGHILDVPTNKARPQKAFTGPVGNTHRSHIYICCRCKQQYARTSWNTWSNVPQPTETTSRHSVTILLSSHCCDKCWGPSHCPSVSMWENCHYCCDYGTQSTTLNVQHVLLSGYNMCIFPNRPSVGGSRKSKTWTTFKRSKCDVLTLNQETSIPPKLRAAHKATKGWRGVIKSTLP